MLMDEPFGETDPLTRERLQDEFLELQSSMGKTIIFVTHDFDEAIKLGDRIVVLSEQSRIEQFDTPAEILARPANEYVASFIGHGAALKRLPLYSVGALTLRPAAQGVSTVHVTDDLREVVNALVLSGQDTVNVLDADGGVSGSITLEDVSRAIRSRRSAV